MPGVECRMSAVISNDPDESLGRRNPVTEPVEVAELVECNPAPPHTSVARDVATLHFQLLTFNFQLLQ